MTSGEKGMAVLVAGFLVLIVAAVVLQLTGHHGGAAIAGSFGPFVWVNGVLIWVAVFDSRKRWPGEPFMQRLGSILSFRRD
jgi:ACR3 family arsenite efflux pump ArsB